MLDLNVRKSICGLLICLFLIGMYLMNYHTMLIVDDYALSFVHEHRIASFSDIFTLLYEQYFGWGGRTIAHFFATLFLWIGKPIFNVFNTIAYIGLILLMYFHAVGRIAFFPMILLIINVLIFKFTPAFGQDFLWLDGACNYLIGACLVLAFLIPYRMQFAKNDSLISNKYFFPLIFLAGVIAAWTNENMAVTVVCMTGFCIAIRYRSDKIFEKWEIFGFLGSLLGSFIILLAPGNFVRMRIEGGGQHVDVIHNFFHITKLFVDQNYLMFLILFGILLAIWGINRVPKIWLWYLFGFLISMYAMLGSPYYTDRAKLGSLLLCIILVCHLYTWLDFSNFKIRQTVAIIGVALFLCMCSDYVKAMRDINSYEIREKQRIAYALSEKQNGNLHVIVEKNSPATKYCAAWGLEDISTNTEHWVNRSFAGYYELKTVRVK